MVTVILTCWKRFENFEKIIKAWLDQSLVTEIIIWDNSGKFKTNLPVHLINSNINVNPSVRYMLANISKNQIIINADDDVIPKSNFVNDWIKHFKFNCFFGISGFIFENSFQKRTIIRSNEINCIKNVDLIAGCITMINRNLLLNHDYKSFEICQLEVSLQCSLSRNIKKYVIPTKEYEILPEMHDENALYKKTEANFIYNNLFNKYFSIKI